MPHRIENYNSIGAGEENGSKKLIVPFIVLEKLS